MKTTGEKIREGRANLGITQTELAEKIGVTLRTISKYEKQGVMPRGANLQKLAEVLGVSIAYLSNDEIVDPAYGLEESPYIESARAVYGKRGAADVEQLLLRPEPSSPVAMYRRKIRNSSSRQSPRLILPTSSVPARSSPARIIRNKPDHLCVYGLLDTPFGTFMLYDRLFYF